MAHPCYLLTPALCLHLFPSPPPLERGTGSLSFSGCLCVCVLSLSLTVGFLYEQEHGGWAPSYGPTHPQMQGQGLEPSQRGSPADVTAVWCLLASLTWSGPCTHVDEWSQQKGIFMSVPPRPLLTSGLSVEERQKPGESQRPQGLGRLSPGLISRSLQRAGCSGCRHFACLNPPAFSPFTPDLPPPLPQISRYT